MVSFEADVVVVGSGPGGATVARGAGAAAAGVSCSSSEASTTARGPGTGRISAGCSTRSERGFLFAREGLTIVRPLMVGGATSMYCGCAAPPPPWLRERYGIDLDLYVAETVAELGVTPLPAPLRGPASTRLAEAARALGYGFAAAAEARPAGPDPAVFAARRVHARLPLRREVERGRVRRRGDRGRCGAPHDEPA